MNKQQQLVKKLTVRGVIFVVLLVILGAAYYFSGNAADGVIARKTEAETAEKGVETQVANLKTQIQKSGDAEKEFGSIQTSRSNLDFTANSDTMRDLLKAQKAQFRFSNNFKLSVTPEKTSDKANQISENYAVTIRPHMKMEFDAISDVHVFSFMDAFTRQAPGLVRFERVALKRKGDIDAIIEFSWIGIAPQEAKSGSTPAAGGNQ